MNSVSLKCLVCCDPITVTPGIEENSLRAWHNNFDAFCTYLNIVPSRLKEGERENNCELLFSFCLDCNNYIQKLHTVDNLEKNEVRDIVSNIVHKIIKTADHHHDDGKDRSKNKDDAMITQKETDIPLCFSNDHKLIGPQQIIISQIICDRVAERLCTLRELVSLQEGQGNDKEKLTSDETVAVEALSELARDKDDDGKTQPCPSKGRDAEGSTVTCQLDGEDEENCSVVPSDAIIEVTVNLNVHLGKKTKNNNNKIELVELKSDDDDDDDDMEVVQDPDYRSHKKGKRRPTPQGTKRKKPIVKEEDDELDRLPAMISVMTADPGVFQYGQWKFKELIQYKKYECLECGDISFRHSTMVRHIHFAHALNSGKTPSPESPVRMDEDGTCHFKNMKFVKTESGRFKCGQCHIERSYMFHMVKHINETHNEDPVELSCEKCGKCGINQEGMTKHKCHKMLKNFKKIVDLGDGKHLYGEWPYETVDGVGYKCQTCGSIRRTTEIMHKHIRERHSDAHKFVCGLCDFSTTRQDMLVNHRTTHGTDPATPRNKFSCGTCTKQYQHRFRLNQHLRLKGHKSADPHYSDKTQLSSSSVRKKTKHVRAQN